VAAPVAERGEHHGPTRAGTSPFAATTSCGRLASLADGPGSLPSGRSASRLGEEDNDNVVPREMALDELRSRDLPDIGTSRAVMDVAKQQVLASLPGLPV